MVNAIQGRIGANFSVFELTDDLTINLLHSEQTLSIFGIVCIVCIKSVIFFS